MVNKKRMSASEWIENYWYHYKSATLVGLFFAFVFLVGVVQCSMRTTADVMMMYTGPTSLSLDAIHQLEASSAEVLDTDCNGDGNVYVQYLENVVLFEDQTVKDETGEEVVVQDRAEQIESYVTQVAIGDAQIYLLSPEVYTELTKQNVLVPLEELYGRVPVEALDSTGWRLGDLEIASLPGFRNLPADTVLCLRQKKTLAVRDEAQAENEHEWAKELFLKLVDYSVE